MFEIFMVAQNDIWCIQSLEYNIILVFASITVNNYEPVLKIINIYIDNSHSIILNLILHGFANFIETLIKYFLDTLINYIT